MSSLLRTKVYDRFVSGKANYVDDLEFPNMASCVFIGSAYAHARIKNIDTSKALNVPGVLAVITGKDLPNLMEPVPAPYVDLPNIRVWRTPIVYPLAVDKVRFYGEPVAAVVAEHANAALDAIEFVNIDCEPLHPVTDALNAMQPDAPLIYEDWKDNIQVHLNFDFGDVDSAFREADRVLKASWREGRVSGFPLESRGCVASYDKARGTLLLWSSTQCPFLYQQALSKMLRLPTSSVKVKTPDIGGGFGSKDGASSWKDALVCVASMMIGRPVKWYESKREFLATGPHQRDVMWDSDVAVRNDGRILGVKAKFIVDLGAEGTNRGEGALSMVPACRAVPNAYRLKGLRIDAYGVVTNKSVYGAYRGFGKDKGIKFMERIVDLTHRQCNINAEDVRFRNFIEQQDFPHKTISGLVYDSGNYPAVLRESLRLAEIDSWRKRQKDLRKKGKYVGIGMAFVVEPAGLSSAMSYVVEPTAVCAPNTLYNGLTQARIRVTLDGMVQVFSDWTEIGQGSTLSMTKVVSDILGTKIDDLIIKPATSEMVGCGPISSRGCVYSLGAVVKAAKQLREKVIALASLFLQENAANISIKDSTIYSVKNPESRMTLRQLAEKTQSYMGRRSLPRELEEHEMLLDTSAFWYSPNTTLNPTSSYTTFCSCADIAIVEVDIETGAVGIVNYVHVHDAGKIIDEDIVRGQIYGGIAQGIGEALREELVYDKMGHLLSSSYTDFVMPTASDCPDILLAYIESPSPFTALGQKGMGESSIIGSKAAIISAIEDALSPYGITIEESPATMERVRQLVLRAQRGR